MDVRSLLGSSLVPESSSVLKAFGPMPAFLFLWMALIIINPTSNAIIALTFANYALKPFFPNCAVPPLAVDLLAASTIGNTEYFQMPDVLSGSQTKVSSLTLAFYSGVFSFSGYSYLNFVTEELKEPYRNLPRSNPTFIAKCNPEYITCNMAYFAVLSVDEILECRMRADNVRWKVDGAIAASDAHFCCRLLHAWKSERHSFHVFPVPRMFLLVHAEEGQLPEMLSMISIDYLTPLPSLLFLGVASIVMLFAGDVLTAVINKLLCVFESPRCSDIGSRPGENAFLTTSGEDTNQAEYIHSTSISLFLLPVSGVTVPLPTTRIDSWRGDDSVRRTSVLHIREKYAK
ncbi:hypothetical protein COOONC_07341 [Cooperia oncophora]